MLVNLRELALFHNQLETVPSEIGGLTQLTELWLFDNKLHTLPESLGNLAALQCGPTLAFFKSECCEQSAPGSPCECLTDVPWSPMCFVEFMDTDVHSFATCIFCNHTSTSLAM